jgi:hypothetical protein
MRLVGCRNPGHKADKEEHGVFHGAYFHAQHYTKSAADAPRVTEYPP